MIDVAPADAGPLPSRRRARARAASRWSQPHPDTAARRPGLVLLARLVGGGGDLMTVAKVLEHELRCTPTEALTLAADLRDRSTEPLADVAS